MITIYGMTDSGNCYKPRLLLAKLGRPFRHVEVNSLDGSTRKPDFLAINANGKVPVLELDDGRRVAESNAILLFLAENTRFLPADPYQRALAYQWLFFEQYSHEPYVAVRRAIMRYPSRAAEATQERLAATLTAGNRALAVMETHLATHAYFAGDELSVADIGLYAYTQDAAEHGFSVGPAVAGWLDRVRADPDHVPLGWHPPA